MNPLRRRNVRIRQLVDDITDGVWGNAPCRLIPRNVPGNVVRAVLARLPGRRQGVGTPSAFPERDAPLVTRAGMA